MSKRIVQEIIDFITDGNVSDFSGLSDEGNENELEINSSKKLTMGETESSEDEVTICLEHVFQFKMNKRMIQVIVVIVIVTLRIQTKVRI